MFYFELFVCINNIKGLIKKLMQFLFIWYLMDCFIYIYIAPLQSSLSCIKHNYANFHSVFKRFLTCTFWYTFDLTHGFLFYIFSSCKTPFCGTFYYWEEKRLHWDIPGKYGKCGVISLFFAKQWCAWWSIIRVQFL